MLDALGLIEKHRGKGVLVDANLLVLLLVGLVNPRRIQSFKRTQDFTIEDHLRLVWLIDCFGRLIATPHVLSQVSDLTDLRGRELNLIRDRFRLTVHDMHEFYDESRVLVEHPTFKRFGLADAAIAAVCSRGILVLTADLDLQLALQERGLDALNFNHVRPLP